MHDDAQEKPTQGLGPIQFDLRSTLIANVILQVLFIAVFCMLKPSSLIALTSVFTVVLYWSLATLAIFRRQRLTALERIALRIGFGFLLPLGALIASFVLRL